MSRATLHGRSAVRRLVVLSLLVLASSPVLAHPGGLAADGCHYDRRNGGRHCHSSGSSNESKRSAPVTLRSSEGGGAFFANCSAARAAGAAPVRRGDPGYSSKLDRDGDGVGCE